MATTVEVITSPDSTLSPKALQIARQAASKLDDIIVYAIDTVTESGAQYAATLSISRKPAIVINGRLAFEGVPKKKEIACMIAQERIQPIEKRR